MPSNRGRKQTSQFLHSAFRSRIVRSPNRCEDPVPSKFAVTIAIFMPNSIDSRLQVYAIVKVKADSIQKKIAVLTFGILV